MRSERFETCSRYSPTASRTFLFALSCALILDVGALGRPQAGGIPAAGPKVRMVRSVAGTRGEVRAGGYEISEVNGPDIKSENNFDASPVKTTRKQVNGDGARMRVTFPPHSYTMIKGNLKRG